MSAPIVWPEAALDPVARARVVAVSIPAAALAETTLSAPFDETWAWISDLSRSVPSFDRDVSAIRIRSRSDVGGGAEELTATVRSHGVPWPFTVRLEPGFCLMQARGRAYVVVMAAVPEPGDPTRTRFVHVEGVALQGTGVLRPVLERRGRDQRRSGDPTLFRPPNWSGAILVRGISAGQTLFQVSLTLGGESTRFE